MAHCPICDAEVEVDDYMEGDLITCIDCNENLTLVRIGKRLALETQDDYAQLLDRLGVRRTNPNFWAHADNVFETAQRNNPIETGILDFNRLENR